MNPIDRAHQAAGPSVWAIVLNWNRREDTLACLESLASMDATWDVTGGETGDVTAAATGDVTAGVTGDRPGFDLHLLLVDNGSTDGSLEAVAEAWPAVERLALPENVGYARGINAGVERALAAGADWTFLVNNDAVVGPDALAKLLAAADDPRIGLLTPTIYYYDIPGTVWPSAGFRRKLTLAGVDTTARPPSPAPYDVDWATGCALLVRAQVWAAVGLLDTRFVMYYEDHDFCLRAEGAGWRLVHVPAAHVWHRVSASSGGVGSVRHMYALGKSSVLFFAKHAHGAQRLMMVPYRLGSLIRTVYDAGRRGKWAAGWAYVRGVADGLTTVLEKDDGRRIDTPQST